MTLELFFISSQKDKKSERKKKRLRPHIPICMIFAATTRTTTLASESRSPIISSTTVPIEKSFQTANEERSSTAYSYFPLTYYHHCMVSLSGKNLANEPHDWNFVWPLIMIRRLQHLHNNQGKIPNLLCHCYLLVWSLENWKIFRQIEPKDFLVHQMSSKSNLIWIHAQQKLISLDFEETTFEFRSTTNVFRAEVIIENLWLDWSSSSSSLTTFWISKNQWREKLPILDIDISQSTTFKTERHCYDYWKAAYRQNCKWAKRRTDRFL